jgi:hypothetical protein
MIKNFKFIKYKIIFLFDLIKYYIFFYLKRIHKNKFAYF